MKSEGTARRSSVAVIIPAFNAAQTLARAVESALAQRRAPSHIIVVDDGSTDDTRRVAAEYGERIDFIRQENQGVSAARNAGLAKTNADYVVFLDSDDAILPDMTAVLADSLDAHPEAPAASGAFIHVTVSGRRRRPHEGGPFGTGACVALSDAFTAERLHQAFALQASMFRRSTVLKVGGFRHGLRFGQDVHLRMRVAGQGPWLFCNREVLEYHQHPSTSRTLRTPAVEQGLAFLLSEEEIERWIPANLRDSYRRLAADVMINRARQYLHARRPDAALATLQRVPDVHRSVPWFGTRLLARLPAPAAVAWFDLRAGARRGLERLGLR